MGGTARAGREWGKGGRVGDGKSEGARKSESDGKENNLKSRNMLLYNQWLVQHVFGNSSNLEKQLFEVFCDEVTFPKA